jgi:hypothetical protein
VTKPYSTPTVRQMGTVDELVRAGLGCTCRMNQSCLPHVFQQSSKKSSGAVGAAPSVAEPQRTESSNADGSSTPRD